MNIRCTFPSETTGAVLDLQKGRAIVSLTPVELDFLANLSELIFMTQDDVSTPPPVTIDTTAEAVGQ